MGTLTPTIERLQKRLDKDPNSLIFLQLADEYRKEKLYEDALKACQEGLRRHPNYWSARVAMGRIYYEMGDRERAREELEKVIHAIPDNLLANRLLGDIYFESKRYEDSLKRYKLVQMLTPADPEVSGNIQKIESRLLSTAPPPPSEPSSGFPSFAPPPPPVTLISEPHPEGIEKIEPEPLPVEPAVEYETHQTSVESAEYAESESFSSVTVNSEEIIDEPEPSLDEIASHFLSIESDTAGLAEEEYQSLAEQSGDLSGTTEESQPVIEVPKKVEDQTQPIEGEDGEAEADELTTQTLAELYVQQGLVDKAVKVYQKLLLNDPNNEHILQRLSELSPREAAVFESPPPAPSVKEVASLPPSPKMDEASAVKTLDQIAAERRRKITTLENWLTMIRRERS